VRTGIVIRDDSIWQGHPDVALFKEKLFVTHRISDRHLTNQSTRVEISQSKCDVIDFTNTVFTCESPHRLNCPRLSVVDDTLYLVCDVIKSGGDYIRAENIETQTSVVIWSTKDGVKWSNPINSNIKGIVPDRMMRTLSGQLLIATHTKQAFYDSPHTESTDTPDKEFEAYAKEQSKGRLVQNVWTADDPEGIWSKHELAADWTHNFCEASISERSGTLICLLRENSGKGLPAYMSQSHTGTTWTKPVKTRMFGCHRPVSGFLESGRFLTTYRECSHSFAKGYWAKNTFACLTHSDSVLNKNNPFYNSVILPLDHDNSPRSDSGYTGWVQLHDDSIFIVNYITKDAPHPYIVWYIINEGDF